MSPQGITAAGRAELSALTNRRRFIAPRDAASELGVSPHVAARKLAGWAEHGWLRRVRRGLYIPVPLEAERPERWAADPMLVADAVWAPCYFTGWTAAGHWGLTDQVFRTVVLKTTQRVRASYETLLDTDYLLAHTAADSIAWGTRKVWREGIPVLIADPARTVIDVLDSPRLAGGVRHGAEILSAYLDEPGEAETLIDYADLLGNRAVFKRLGYLLQALGRDEPRLSDACAKRLSAGFARLDPDGPPQAQRVGRWRILANATIAPESPS